MRTIPLRHHIPLSCQWRTGRRWASYPPGTSRLFRAANNTGRRILWPGILPGGANRRTRTVDLLITNQLLYQLSYAGIMWDGPDLNRRHNFLWPTELPSHIARIRRARFDYRLIAMV